MKQENEASQRAFESRWVKINPNANTSFCFRKREDGKYVYANVLSAWLWWETSEFRSAADIEVVKHDRDYAVGMLERKDAEIERLKVLLLVISGKASDALPYTPDHIPRTLFREIVDIAAADKLAKGDA